jgi:dynein heavy chain
MGHLQKFLASLTELVHQVKGSTVLYIPEEDLSDIEKAAQDKDLVQRLEGNSIKMNFSEKILAILIHWIRQIKELLTNQDNAEISESAGPLAEIEFWRARTVDLSGIKDQLERDEVKRITNVLDIGKSTYLVTFLKLSESIQKGSAEAQDNLKFLSNLQEPCEKLAAATPSQIPTILPIILNNIRMIWGLSRYYNSPERLTGLLRKV